MRLSNPAGYFAILLLAVITVIGCRGSESTSDTESPSPPEPARRTPFPAKEPEVYRAEYSIATGPLERTIRVTRNGGSFRIDLDPSTDRHFVIIESDGKYLINAASGIYTEAGGERVGSNTDAEELRALLTIGRKADFERSGTEDGLAKYIVRQSGNDLSEAYVFVDDSIGMPVRIEYYTGSGDDKVMTYSVTMNQFSREVSDELFKPDPNFKKVSSDEFYRRLRR